MKNVNESINLGKVKENSISKYHVPSRVQPDTLFHFTSKMDYLIDSLKKREISPSYCDEDLKYFGFNNVKHVAIPMSCFCDIGLQKLEIHMDCYGYYGLAFKKEWCMKHGMQPITYLNKDADLVKDFKISFNMAMAAKRDTESAAQKQLQNLLLHQIMYCKPYDGMFKFRRDQKNHKKCFADECEWRYIPDLSTLKDMRQIISDELTISEDRLSLYNASLRSKKGIGLTFKYDDLKYVIVKNTNDYLRLLQEIKNWQINGKIGNDDGFQLLPKMLIWDDIKGDF